MTARILPKKVSFRDETPNKTQTLADVRVISPKQDSIAPASPPPSFDLAAHASGPVRTRLGCLRYLIPNCLYDLICWLFCLREYHRRAPEVEERDLEPLAPVEEAPASPQPANLEEWIEQCKASWESSQKDFDACDVLLVIKTREKGAWRSTTVTHKKLYTKQNYQNFSDEVTEFSSKFKDKTLLKFRATLVTIRHNSNGPFPEEDITSIVLKNGKLQTSSWSNLTDLSLTRQEIHKTYPLLEKTGIKISDLTLS